MYIIGWTHSMFNCIDSCYWFVRLARYKHSNFIIYRALIESRFMIHQNIIKEKTSVDRCITINWSILKSRSQKTLVLRIYVKGYTKAMSPTQLWQGTTNKWTLAYYPRAYTASHPTHLGSPEQFVCLSVRFVWLTITKIILWWHTFVPNIQNKLWLRAT